MENKNSANYGVRTFGFNDEKINYSEFKIKKEEST
jgi:hypothetical protein